MPVADACAEPITVRDLEAAKETLRAEVKGLSDKLDERERQSKEAARIAAVALEARTAAKLWAFGMIITVIVGMGAAYIGHQ